MSLIILVHSNILTLRPSIRALPFSHIIDELPFEFAQIRVLDNGITVEATIFVPSPGISTITNDD